MHYTVSYLVTHLLLELKGCNMQLQLCSVIVCESTSLMDIGCTPVLVLLVETVPITSCSNLVLGYSERCMKAKAHGTKEKLEDFE